MGDRVEIFIDQPNTGHLGIKSDPGYRAGIDAAFVDAIFHTFGRSGIKIFQMLLNLSRVWVVERDFQTCLSKFGAVHSIDCRLGTARAEIDTNQVVLCHLLSSLIEW